MCACFISEEETWSIMGINPMALARRKHPGSTGSYVHKLKEVKNYIWEMDDTLISLVIFDGCVPAWGQEHQEDRCLHTMSLGWIHSCEDKQPMSTRSGQPEIELDVINHNSWWACGYYRTEMFGFRLWGLAQFGELTELTKKRIMFGFWFNSASFRPKRTNQILN